MDTSVDQSTVALDFLSGDGVNFPRPTHEQCARRIIAISERLWQNDILHGIIANSTIGSSRLASVYVLKEAMERFMPERYEELKTARFMRVKDTSANQGDLSREEGVSAYLYLGYSRSEVFWFWVEAWKYDHRKPRSDGKSGPTACTELNVVSMTEVFSRFNWATPFPQHIVEWLLRHVKQERDRRRENLFNWEKQTTLLEVDRELFDAIDEMPRQLDGFES